MAHVCRSQDAIKHRLDAFDPDQALKQLSALKDLGVRLAIDDFGTGYSALAYLKRYPFDSLKLDRLFLTDMVKDDVARSIAGSVIDLGHTLGMEVIAEGVESAEQLEVLRGLGCDLAQGYLLGHPEPADVFQRQYLQ